MIIIIFLSAREQQKEPEIESETNMLLLLPELNERCLGD